MDSIIIPGEVPSKKNSRILNTKTKKSFPNKKYTEWHDSTVLLLRANLNSGKIHKVPEGCKVKLRVIFCHGDLVNRDSDNQLSSILDTFVDAGIFVDDNWKVIPFKQVEDIYEKRNPYAKISWSCENDNSV